MVRRNLGPRRQAYRCDVSDPGAVAQLLQQVTRDARLGVAWRGIVVEALGESSVPCGSVRGLWGNGRDCALYHDGDRLFLYFPDLKLEDTHTHAV